MKTPILFKKQTSLKIENDSKSLTIKMMKNKENLNINCLNNRYVINNYSCKKCSKLIYSKIENKCNYIEPKNLFHNSALKNINSNSLRNLF